MEHCNPNSKSNPIFKVSRDELLEWLRYKISTETEFADRTLSAVQINVSIPFSGGRTFHHEVPELVLMVSNVPGTDEHAQNEKASEDEVQEDEGIQEA